MCLIAIAIEQDEKYPFIFLSNRDEFYQRPTESMHWWEGENILAGKDLIAGGTWLGINNRKQFAAVTNYRDPQRNDPKAPSRGAIPADILKDNPDDFGYYVSQHQSLWSRMNGFNLLYHNGKCTFYYSNISKEIIQLNKGIYAISNAFLDTPWPKVTQSKLALQAIIANQKITADHLLELLGDNHRFPDEMLPNTGVGLEWERMLSPLSIQSPIYGTRTHTIILKDSSGTLHITEKQTLSDERNEFDVL